MPLHNDKWEKAQQLFGAALERERGERESFLNLACGEDVELRAEVDSLLEAHQRTGVIDELGHDFASLSATLAGKLEAGHRIGAYRVEREIGQGGMGSVYLARRDDADFAQQVAIKLAQVGHDDPRSRERFLIERQILAGLEHPNIARLVDGGIAEDGRPFFAMEFVQGVPITKYCDHERLTVESRLRLFADVCDAVEYAHRNLIVHRDLKPSNILVNADGQVKLPDFGIAKMLAATGSASTTQTAARWWTPGYASPEQSRGSPITTASDVYSLGVLLYELLTGHRPYDFASKEPFDIQKVICEQEPEKPSTAIATTKKTELDGKTVTISAAQVGDTRRIGLDRLKRLLSGDLDTIVLKALQKEPDRRYTSARELREDISRYLNGLPVLARPDTFAYRLSKHIRRNKVGTAAGVVVLATLLLGSVGIAWQARRAAAQAEIAASERDFAREAAAKAERTSRLVIDMFKLTDSVADGNMIQARDVLDRQRDRVVRGFAEEPTVKADLLLELSQLYQRLGLHGESHTAIVEAIELQRLHLGDQHPDLAESIHQLGRLFAEEDANDSAEVYLRSALAMRRATLPNDHPDIASSLYELGAVLTDTGRLPVADTLLRAALEIRKKRLGATHPDVAATIYLLANVQHNVGNFTGGNELYEEALRIYALQPDRTHPLAAASLAAMGQVYMYRRETEKARPLLERSLAMRRMLYPPEHPDVLDGTGMLALLAFVETDYLSADTLFTQLAKAVEPVEGRGQEVLLSMLSTWGQTKIVMEEYDKANELIARGVTEYSAAYGPSHSSTRAMRIALFDVLLAQGEYDAAEEGFRKAIEETYALGESGTAREVELLSKLARVRQALGDVRPADSLYRQAISIASATFREGHRYPLILKAGYARLLYEAGLLDSAETMFREALSGFRESHSPNHLSIAGTSTGLGIVLTAQGKAELAHPLLVEGLRISELRLPSDQRSVVYARSALGECLSKLGRYDEAKDLLEAALAVQQTKLGPQHRHTQATRRRLAALYEAAGTR